MPIWSPRRNIVLESHVLDNVGVQHSKQLDDGSIMTVDIKAAQDDSACPRICPYDGTAEGVHVFHLRAPDVLRYLAVVEYAFTLDTVRTIPSPSVRPQTTLR